MDKFLGQEIPEENRKSFLNDNCDSVETIGYTRHFSPDELNQKKGRTGRSFNKDSRNRRRKERSNEFIQGAA